MITKFKSAEEWRKLAMSIEVSETETDDEWLARVDKFYQQIQANALREAARIVKENAPFAPTFSGENFVLEKLVGKLEQAAISIEKGKYGIS